MAIITYRDYRRDNPNEFDLGPLTSGNYNSEDWITAVLLVVVALLMVYLGVVNYHQPVPASLTPTREGLASSTAAGIHRDAHPNGAYTLAPGFAP